jgi:hypothetical protein
MESCLQADLRDLGYRLHFANPAWRPVLMVSGWFLYTIEPLLSRAIPYLQRRNYLPATLHI